MRKIIRNIYDWSQKPIGDGILGGILFSAALVAIYLLGWLLMP